jgi:hypothetical protein
MAKKKKEEEILETTVMEDSSVLKLYKISLPSLPSMEIHAFNEADAIAAYNSFMNVISTENKYQVTIL